MKIAAVIAVVVVIAAVVAWYLVFLAPYESTDDAFIEAHVTIVSPRVSGPVTLLLVRDNQHCREGEMLLEIDPRDYETKVAQNQADLASARSQLAQSRAQEIVDDAKVRQQRSVVVAADAEAERAAADLKRYEAVESRAVSRAQLDLARSQAQATQANAQVGRSQVAAADAQLGLSHVSVDAAAAKVQQAEAKLKQAELDLSYTKVAAPITGRVTRRTVETGAFVQTGQSLLALVPDDVWVVANFKETQLARMRPGQPATIRLDAYRNREFKGHVDSIQAGTGARFSLLPPENAVGNYVKVVQRVPVKIIFDEPLDEHLDIAPGMSVVPKVRVK
jgi:membrane fusion protein, multidrug efflux system